MAQEYDDPQQFEGTVTETAFSHTQSGIALLKINFYLTYRGWDSKLKEPTPFKAYYTLTLWRDEAEEVSQLVEKDRRIRVTGYAKTRKYTDHDGVEQTTKTPEIVNPKVDLAFLRTQAGLIHSAEDDEDTTAAAAIADLL